MRTEGRLRVISGSFRGFQGAYGRFNGSQKVPRKFQRVSELFQVSNSRCQRRFKRYHVVSGAFEGVLGWFHRVLLVSIGSMGSQRDSGGLIGSHGISRVPQRRFKESMTLYTHFYTAVCELR